jgi:hypothetical protein
MVQFGGRVCYRLRPWLVVARASLRHKSMRHCTRAVLPTERHNTPTTFPRTDTESAERES